MTEYSSSYDMLANAFLRGSISLLEKPSQALMNLENPYDYLNRGGIDYIWDATYFNGKYYLYWGFVPAFSLLASRCSMQPGLKISNWFFLPGWSDSRALCDLPFSSGQVFFQVSRLDSRILQSLRPCSVSP